MSNKIIISTDGACDLPQDILTKYNIMTSPMGINLNGNTYYADIEITKQDIYNEYKKNGAIAKTAAISVGEFIEYFKNWVEQGYEVIHLSIGSQVSCSYQNCFAACAEYENSVHVIDTGCISTGLAMLAIEASSMVEEGLSAQEIVNALNKLKNKVRHNYIIEKLDFLKAGGRCSRLSFLGANLLSIKPTIIISKGVLEPGKKYRGNWNKVVIDFLTETLNSHKITGDKFFITQSDVEKPLLDKITAIVKSKTNINQVYVTETKATIFCHCGPNALGFIFFEE